MKAWSDLGAWLTAFLVVLMTIVTVPADEAGATSKPPLRIALIDLFVHH